MWNGTMFVDLDWPLNASSLLSASAELLVITSVEEDMFYQTFIYWFDYMSVNSLNEK